LRGTRNLLPKWNTKSILARLVQQGTTKLYIYIYRVYRTWPDRLVGKMGRRGDIVGLRDSPSLLSKGLQVSKAIVCWHNKF